MLVSMPSWMLMLQLSAVGEETCFGGCVADAKAAIHGDALLQPQPWPRAMQQHALLEDASHECIETRGVTNEVQPTRWEVAKGLAWKHGNIMMQKMSRFNLTFGVDEEKRKIQPIQDIVLSKIDLVEKRPMKVAVFVQAFNLLLLPYLQECITNVGAAQANTGSTVDVYLSTPSVTDEQIQLIEESVKHFTPALGLLEVQKTQNKGADMGQLLQQMQSTSGRNYDVILKIHTKTDAVIRQFILDRLCGSTDTAQKIIASFAANPALGLAGANGWMSWRGKPQGSNDAHGMVWDNKGERENMKKIWRIISPDTPMPPEMAWTCAVTSFWWSRGSSVTRNPVLLAAADRLLAIMQWGYTRNSGAQPEHALERLIGTMVRAEGAVIARVMP